MKTVRYYSELIGGRALYAVCKDIKEAQAKLSEFIDADKFTFTIINRIANRAVALAADAGVEYEKLTATMDLTACHLNGCPLDLNKLEAAPDSDFGHDVFGIRRHIDRRTGRLTDHFVPRCAL